MGITEPAIFGVNLRFFKPFIAGCIGGGLGAMFASIVGLAAAGTGVTGIFGILLCLNQPVQYVIMFAIAGLVAFGLSYMLYRDETPNAEAVQAEPTTNATVQASVNATARDEAEAAAVSAAAADAAIAAVNGSVASDVQPATIVSPMAGTAIPMKEVSDPVFASEAMGGGIAIIPDEGKLYAPADGKVIVLADTGHAVGMMTDAGTEILMHIGIDTVGLEGEPFTPHVTVGEHVSTGQLLMDIDLAYIREQGLDTVTPIIITNTAAYEAVEPCASGTVATGDPIIKVH